VEIAAINADDPYGARLAGETPSVVLRYGFDSTADVRIVEAVPRRARSEGPVVGTDLSLATPRGDLRLQSRLIGRPNAYNVLAATAAALALQIEPEQVRRGIEALEGVPGRMERIDRGQPFTVVVDYAHTPDALEKAIQTLSELPHRRLFTVFGCGGDRDRTKRPVMGRIASTGSDVVIATSDNPRTEDPEAILAEIEQGLRQGKAQCSARSDRRGAIRSALENAEAGDIVLIAGKGHETYQVVGKSTLPFDDRQVAREILAELGHGLERPIEGP
jgi:UDP-N-acetylmuramoyl-L-alanyl-D-glutamate--2,6-diaminopimelate ligase